MNLFRPVLSVVLVLLILGVSFALTLYRGEPAQESQVQFPLLEMLLHLGPIWLSLCALAFGSAWMVGGKKGLWVSSLWMLGKERPTDGLLVHRTLASAARTLVAAGLFMSLLASVCIYLHIATVNREVGASPAKIADWITWSIVPGTLALGLGRILLGGCADWASVRAGAPERRAFKGRDDLALLLYLLPPLLCMYSMFLRFEPI